MSNVASTAGTIGILFLPIGLLHWRYAEELSRFEEQIQAIGSKRLSSSVQPAEWKVLLTKYLGMAITAACVLGICYWLVSWLIV